MIRREDMAGMGRPGGVLRPLLFLLAAAAAYSGMARYMMETWRIKDFAQAALIAAIAVWMAWTRRDVMRRTPAGPRPLLGGILLLPGGALLAAGTVLGKESLREASFVPILMAGIVLLWGMDRLRVLAWPVCYLVFMFPVSASPLVPIMWSLQEATAFMAGGWLRLAGIPVYREGVTLVLPHATLEVAAVCSGIRHIVSLAALAMPIAFLTQRSLWRRLAVVLGGAVIGLVMNGVRVALIGIWARTHDIAHVHGPANLLMASSFDVGVGLALLFLLTFALRERPGTDPGQRSLKASSNGRGPR